MGITTVLETEDGSQLETVEDPTNVLHRILPDVGDAAYHYVNYIDWYGDTVFNRLQAPKFLSEWEILESKVTDPEGQRVVEGIRRLGRRLQEEIHVYLKFIGD